MNQVIQDAKTLVQQRMMNMPGSTKSGQQSYLFKSPIQNNTQSRAYIGQHDLYQKESLLSDYKEVLSHKKPHIRIPQALTSLNTTQLANFMGHRSTSNQEQPEYQSI